MTPLSVFGIMAAVLAGASLAVFLGREMTMGRVAILLLSVLAALVFCGVLGFVNPALLPLPLGFAAFYLPLLAVALLVHWAMARPGGWWRGARVLAMMVFLGVVPVMVMTAAGGGAAGLVALALSITVAVMLPVPEAPGSAHARTPGVPLNMRRSEPAAWHRPPQW